MPKVILIAHNLRSTHNVGSLLRTAEGLGLEKVYLTGYTPYPEAKNDLRLPHESRKIAKQINKTALGAENSIDWEHGQIENVIKKLKSENYEVVALEQTPTSQPLNDFKPPEKIVIIVGREVEGIEAEIIKQTDQQIEIPMLGQKESFNVVQATAMALYHCLYR